MAAVLCEEARRNPPLRWRPYRRHRITRPFIWGRLGEQSGGRLIFMRPRRRGSVRLTRHDRGDRWRGPCAGERPRSA